MYYRNGDKMILGISDNSERFLLKSNDIYKYFSLKNGNFICDSNYKSIDFVKFGIVCIINNDKNIEFYNMNDDLKILESNLKFQIDEILDISKDLSLILVKNADEILLVDTKSSEILNKFIFKNNSKVKVELSKDAKYVIYKDEIIHIYYIEKNELITITTRSTVYSSTYFLINNDKLIIIGRYFGNGSNFAIYDLKSNQLQNECNCSMGKRITSYVLSCLINKDLIASVGILGTFDQYPRFMLAKTNGEYIDYYDLKNITKFISSNDGNYLLLEEENNKNSNNLYFIDFGSFGDNLQNEDIKDYSFI